jgi:hypothetical protein
MATTIWNNNGGVWDTDANWTGSHPADGDTAIFSSGSQSVTTAPGTTDEDITLQIDRAFSGDFGSSGAEIVLRVNKCIHEGTGTLWLNSDAGTNEFSDVVIINSTNTTNAATLGGDEIARIYVRNGNVTISGGLVHDFELYVVGSGANVTVAAGAGGTAATAGAARGLNLYQTAGIVTSNVVWDDAYVSGGVFTHDNAAISNLTCMGGTCHLNYRDTGGAEVSGDVFVGGGGLIDLTNDVTGGFTISGDLGVCEGGTFRYYQGHLTVSGNTANAGGSFVAI